MMRNMERRRTAVAAVFGALACTGLAACSYQPTIRHPTLSGAEQEMIRDCASLDTAILKADTVRWVIRDDGGELLTAAAREARIAANVALMVATTIATWDLLLVPSLGGIDDRSGHAVLDAADLRIVDLLRIKKQQACADRPTSRPGISDLQMLELLEPLVDTARVPDRAALDERTALLDELREPVPASAAPGP